VNSAYEMFAESKLRSLATKARIQESEMAKGCAVLFPAMFGAMEEKLGPLIRPYHKN